MIGFTQMGADKRRWWTRIFCLSQITRITQIGECNARYGLCVMGYGCGSALHVMGYALWVL